MSNSDTVGFLTSGDKDWLCGEVEYEYRQSASNRRTGVRERVAAGLRDFNVLNEHWTEDERRRLLEEFEDPETAAAEVIEFLYVWLNERAADPGAMVGDQAVDNALAFRRALWNGIRNGKQHFGDVPNYVLIDSNVELFETAPTKELQQELDTTQWRELNKHAKQMVNTPDDVDIDKLEAAGDYERGVKLAIWQKLYNRHCSADSQVRSNNQLSTRSIPVPDKKDATNE